MSDEVLDVVNDIGLAISGEDKGITIRSVVVQLWFLSH